MARVAKTLSFQRSKRGEAFIARVKGDFGGGEIKTLDHYTPLGVDAPPLSIDFIVGVRSARTGLMDAVGYMDTLNEGVAVPGEHRTAGRDSNGATVSQIYQKGDGTIVVQNYNGPTRIHPDVFSTIIHAADCISIPPHVTVT